MKKVRRNVRREGRAEFSNFLIKELEEGVCKSSGRNRRRKKGDRVAGKESIKGGPELFRLFRALGDKVMEIGAFRGGDEFSNKTGLGYEVVKVNRSFVASVESFKFGAFGFLSNDERSNEGFDGARVASDRFERSMDVKDRCESRVE